MRIGGRRNQRRNNGPFVLGADDRWHFIPPRRQHGVMKDVQIVHSAVVRAAKRADLYKHSFARRMDNPDAYVTFPVVGLLNLLPPVLRARALGRSAHLEGEGG